LWGENNCHNGSHHATPAILATAQNSSSKGIDTPILDDRMTEKETIMDKQYIIMKRTRAYDNPTPRNAYQNWDTCQEAGVEPGMVYFDKDDAEYDARRLGKVNPVGFVVIELTDYKLP
jgi:hypothetical protein